MHRSVRSALRLGWLGFPALLALAVLVLSPGCETSFDPFEETDVRFSMFGYLDLSADTQFVRVNELNTSVFTTAEIDAAVALTHVESGRTVTLRDSAVTIRRGAGDGTIVHNFWTTTPIEPEATYRLETTASDGSTASATFRTPAEAPVPVLDAGIIPFSPSPPRAQSITLAGVAKLADIRVRFRLSSPNTLVTISYIDKLFESSDGRLLAGFDAYGDVQDALSGDGSAVCPSLESAEVFVAATTTDWPDFWQFDLETLVLPTTATNVVGGLGYVGGVQTFTLAWPELVGAFFLNQVDCTG
ncbi:MAG: hypothetical protein AAF809_06955 [Bacteroidota bacterium]